VNENADHYPTASQAEEAWRDQALCAQTDPESFFPEKGCSSREAKKVCVECVVKAECLQYALDHDERFGIWGGLSERERRRLRRAYASRDLVIIPVPGLNMALTTVEVDLEEPPADPGTMPLATVA
jgi:WhiB family redox-sensing transcriptional regulator